MPFSQIYLSHQEEDDSEDEDLFGHFQSFEFIAKYNKLLGPSEIPNQLSKFLRQTPDGFLSIGLEAGFIFDCTSVTSATHPP